MLPEPELPRDVLKEGGGSDGIEAPPSEPPPPPLSTLPPVEPEEDELVEVDVPVTVASGLRLGLTWLIDAVVILSTGALIAVLEVLTFSSVRSVEASHPLDVAAYWINANPGPSLHGAVAVGLFAFAYNVIAAKRGGRTAGRLVTGTVLVRASGRRLGWSLVLFRSTVGIVSLALFGAGFFWSILDAKHRTWHDLLSGTVLVRRHVAVPPFNSRGT
ncbi:MAG: RDD family protein [Myxococcota bacterium]